jgi:hypothetical protein
VDASAKSETTSTFYDRNGAKAGTASFWIDGAIRTRIRSVAINSNRQVLAGGNAISSDGKLIGFLILTDFAGKPLLTITTNPYAPEQIAFGEDGTLWALVSLIDMDGTGRGTDYPILRHYSKDGKLLHAILPRSRFPGGLPPAQTAGGSGNVLMQANRDRLGVYFGHTNLWVEADSGGKLTEWIVSPLGGSSGWAKEGTVSAGGLALLDSGSVYMSFTDALNGGLYRLDKERRRWARVEGAQGPLSETPVTMLHGKDGKAIVFSSLTEGTLNWAMIEP